MKKNNLFWATLAIAISMLILQSCKNRENQTEKQDTETRSDSNTNLNQKKNTQKGSFWRNPTPYTEIIEMNDLFNSRIKSSNLRVQTTIIQFDAAEMRVLQKATSCEYFLAVFGLRNSDMLSVNILASNQAGDSVSDRRIADAAVKKLNRDLGTKLGSGTVPFGLSKFPSVIKMNAKEIRQIIDTTNCKNILAYLGIDSSNKLTISIIGSDETGKLPSKMHTQQKSSLNGAETWPDVNYTYYGSGNSKPTDIKWPWK